VQTGELWLVAVFLVFFVAGCTDLEGFFKNFKTQCTFALRFKDIFFKVVSFPLNIIHTFGFKKEKCTIREKTI